VVLADLGLGDLAERSLATLPNEWVRAQALAALASALSHSAPDRATRIAADLLRDPNHWWRALGLLTDIDPAIARAVGARVQGGAAAAS
jgi:hypothetical protein